MKLNDIYKVMDNENLHSEYQSIYQGLAKYKNNHNYFKHNEIFESISSESGYAKKTYRGKLKDGLELTELELSMICDNGFSHFGGSSSIGKDGSFTVVIYTD